MSINASKKPGRGRPFSANPKNLKIEARVTLAEKEALRQMAAARGMTVSELLLTATLGPRKGG
jgi:uncharacterized protein (DUF1778 family)